MCINLVKPNAKRNTTIAGIIFPIFSGVIVNMLRKIERCVYPNAINMASGIVHKSESLPNNFFIIIFYCIYKNNYEELIIFYFSNLCHFLIFLDIP